MVGSGEEEKDESSGKPACSSSLGNGGHEEAIPSAFTDLLAEIRVSLRDDRMKWPLSSNYPGQLLSYPTSESDELVRCNQRFSRLDSELFAPLDVALDNLTFTCSKLEHMRSARNKAQAALSFALEKVKQLQNEISRLMDNEVRLNKNIQYLEHILLQKDIRPEKMEMDYGTVLKERDNALMLVESLKVEKFFLMEDEVALKQNVERLKHVVQDKDFQLEKLNLDFGNVLKERDSALAMLNELVLMREKLSDQEEAFCQKELAHKLMLAGVLESLTEEMNDRVLMRDKCNGHKEFSDKHHQQLEDAVKEHWAALKELDELQLRFKEEEESFCQKELAHKLMLAGVLESLTEEMNDRVLMRDKCNGHKEFSDKHHQQLEDAVKEHWTALKELDELQLRFKEEELKHKNSLNGIIESLSEEMDDRVLVTHDCKKQKESTAKNQQLLEDIVKEHESALKELERIDNEEPISITAIIIALLVSDVCCLITFLLLSSYVIVS